MSGIIFCFLRKTALAFLPIGDDFSNNLVKLAIQNECSMEHTLCYIIFCHAVSHSLIIIHNT